MEKTASTEAQKRPLPQPIHEIERGQPTTSSVSPSKKQKIDKVQEKRNETTVFEPTKSSKPKKLIKSMVADKKQTSMKLRYRSKKVLIRVADLETQLREMQVRLNSVENRIDQLIKNIRIRPKNNPTSIQMSNVKAVPTAPPIQNIQLPSSVVGNPQAPGESMRGGTARQGLVEDDFDY